MLKQRDSGQSPDVIAVMPLQLGGEPEFQRAPSEVELDVVCSAAEIEVRRALHVIGVEQGRITSHQSAPTQQLGPLAQGRTRNARGPGQVESIDRMALSPPQEHALNGTQRREQIVGAELSRPGGQRDVSPPKHGPRSVHPMARAPFSLRTATGTRARFVDGHGMPGIGEGHRRAETSKTRSEHGDSARLKTDPRHQARACESTASTSCNVSKRT